MSEEILTRKILGALRPVDEQGVAALRSIPNGDLVSIKIRRSRNLKHHRLFFALMQLVFDNQSRYDSLDHMVTAIKIAVGHCDTIILKDGKVAWIPKSISFTLGQIEFNQFWDKVITLIVEDYLPGVTREELEREVREMVGGEFKEAKDGDA